LSGGDRVCTAAVRMVSARRHLTDYVERCGGALGRLMLLLLLLLLLVMLGRLLLLLIVWQLVVLTVGHSATRRAAGAAVAAGTAMRRLRLLMLWGPICASVRW
jgi:hypothetical protein